MTTRTLFKTPLRVAARLSAGPGARTRGGAACCAPTTTTCGGPATAVPLARPLPDRGAGMTPRPCRQERYLPGGVRGAPPRAPCGGRPRAWQSGQGSGAAPPPQDATRTTYRKPVREQNHETTRSTHPSPEPGAQACDRRGSAGRHHRRLGRLHRADATGHNRPGSRRGTAAGLVARAASHSHPAAATRPAVRDNGEHGGRSGPIIGIRAGCATCADHGYPVFTVTCSTTTSMPWAARCSPSLTRAVRPLRRP